MCLKFSGTLNIKVCITHNNCAIFLSSTLFVSTAIVYLVLKYGVYTSFLNRLYRLKLKKIYLFNVITNYK